MTLTFANKITICRILAVPFFIITILYYSPDHDSIRLLALGIFLFAVISDVIDGYIARTRNQRTQAGMILDPLADKLLLISAFICLNHVGSQYSIFRLPVWLIVAVISRDAILLIGATLISIIHGTLPQEATRWGKISTFFQVLTVISVLILWPMPLLWYGCLFFTVISGVDYIRRGIKIMNIPSGKIPTT